MVLCDAGRMTRRPSARSAHVQAWRDLSVGLIVKAIPVALVQEALQATGKESKCCRALPATLRVLPVVALGLPMEASAREAPRWLLTRIDTLLGQSAPGHVVSSAAISQGRTALGWAALLWL